MAEFAIRFSKAEVLTSAKRYDQQGFPIEQSDLTLVTENARFHLLDYFDRTGFHQALGSDSSTPFPLQ